MFAWWRRRRRAAVRARPFPPEWRAIIVDNVPLFSRLPAADQVELIGHTQVLLAEKRFVGCGGLTLTDEIRVTIAAQAAVLLLHRTPTYYPKLTSILVYPSTYLAPGGRNAHGLIDPDPQARLGESWARDVVVLAWDGVLSSAADINDGHNLVLHEFAHQLDQETGEANGTPVLPRRSMYVVWGRVLSQDFDALVDDAEHRRSTLLDHYGATNPAEFFAVVTETFFEKPRQLQRKHPELYEQLRAFYQQDPATFDDPDDALRHPEPDEQPDEPGDGHRDRAADGHASDRGRQR